MACTGWWAEKKDSRIGRGPGGWGEDEVRGRESVGVCGREIDGEEEGGGYLQQL